MIVILVGLAIGQIAGGFLILSIAESGTQQILSAMLIGFGILTLGTAAVVRELRRFDQ